MLLVVLMSWNDIEVIADVFLLLADQTNPKKKKTLTMDNAADGYTVRLRNSDIVRADDVAVVVSPTHMSQVPDDIVTASSTDCENSDAYNTDTEPDCHSSNSSSSSDTVTLTNITATYYCLPGRHAVSHRNKLRNGKRTGRGVCHFHDKQRSAKACIS